MNNVSDRPTLGLALSGSGSRLVFYIGFLEELAAQNVPIDYIAAASGASIVAAAFACGRLKEFKDMAFSMSRDQIMEMLPRGKGGLYSLDTVEEFGRKHITMDMRFEDVKPRLGFVASDIETGEQVVLSMGDIARAIRISCTLPFFFEAVKWGGHTLVDGGLLSRIPIDAARHAGVDVVVGVNMRGTPHLFTERQLAVKRTYNFFRKALMIEYLEKVWDSLNADDEGDDYFSFDQSPRMLSVLSRSMEWAIKKTRDKESQNLVCDLMIAPDIKKYTIKNIESSRQELYELGQKTAREYAPKIIALTKSKEQEMTGVKA